MSENLELYKSITELLHEMGCAYVLLVGEDGSNGVHTFSNLEHIAKDQIEQMAASEKMENALHEHFVKKFKNDSTSS
jgi:hypothetical protein